MLSAQSRLLRVLRGITTFLKSCKAAISRCEAQSLTRAGMPRQAASSTGMPKPSTSEGLSRAIALRYRSSLVFSLTYPVRRIPGSRRTISRTALLDNDPTNDVAIVTFQSSEAGEYLCRPIIKDASNPPTSQGAVWRRLGVSAND